MPRQRVPPPVLGTTPQDCAYYLLVLRNKYERLDQRMATMEQSVATLTTTMTAELRRLGQMTTERLTERARFVDVYEGWLKQLRSDVDAMQIQRRGQ